MPNSYNDNKYLQRNTGGRNALDDYIHDREYWIAQGGNPRLSLGDMIYPLYPGKSIQDAMAGAGAAPPVLPSTTTFSFASISNGLTGAADRTSTANRAYLLAGQFTPLVLYIKGTAASLNLFHDGGFGSESGLLGVSVDDGSITYPTGVANKFPLFSGLPDVVHKVVVTVGSGYGPSAYYQTNTSPLEVTGAPPVVQVPGSLLQRSSSDNARWSSVTKAQGTNRLPSPLISTSSVANTSSVPMVRFGTNSGYLDITTVATYVGVAVDGVTTLYSTGAAANKAVTKRITTDGNSHVYSVWSVNDVDVHTSSLVLSVGIAGAPTVLPAQRQMHQYGDSITKAEFATSTAHGDLMKTAAALGFLGSTYGISGATSATLASNIGTQVNEANGNVSTDVGIIAIGRNSYTTFTPSDFDTIATAMLTKYSKVIFRGVLQTLPAISAAVTAYNASLQAWVTSKANPRLIYVPAESWIGIDTVDNVHPSDAGHITLAAYATAAYTALSL